MPTGMTLKSDGFASSLSAPSPGSTLGDYCRAQAIPYDDLNLPVTLETFLSYGSDFQRRFVPMLEEHGVEYLDRTETGYRLRLDSGELVAARQVVLAIGITHFDKTPEALAYLPKVRVSHSSAHRDFQQFKDLDVAVLGSGSSAVDVAANLAEVGARVHLIARKPQIKYRASPTGKPRTLWSRLRHPKSGLGPGIRSWLCCNAPDLFRWLPAAARIAILGRHLGPSSPGYMREKVEGQANLLCGRNLTVAEAIEGRVRLHLHSDSQGSEVLEADHVICGTGYQTQLKRLGFVEGDLRRDLKSVDGAPVVSRYFESSSPGLYFVGIAAASSFGPLMRFMYGAEFAAPRVARRLLARARVN